MKLSTMFCAVAAVALYVTPTLAADAPPPAFAPCKACHKIEACGKSMGPSLFGVYGRKAGTLDGYTYSDGLKAGAWTWDDAKLAAWLANPKAVVPTTKMAFPGVKNPDDITAIVGFLKTLK